MSETTPDLLAQRPWIRHYDAGVPATLATSARTLPQLLRDTALAFPDNTALRFFGARMPYRALDRAADRFAAGLAARGVTPGDRVALVLPNCPQFLIAYFGALRAGAIVVPFNPTYVECELTHQLRDCGAKVVVTLTLFFPKIAAVQAETAVEQIIVGNIKDYFPAHTKLLFTLFKEQKDGHRFTGGGTGVVTWQEMMRVAPKPPDISMLPDDVAIYQYTGGTTGVAKGAMLTHRNLVANAEMCVAWMNATPNGQGACLAVIPFFHVYGMTVAMNTSIILGATLILLPQLDLNDATQAIQRYRPTHFPGVPALYIALLDYKPFAAIDASSLEICLSGASPLPIEVQHRFEKATGAQLVEGFGMTECSPVSHCSPFHGLRKAGSIGIPYPNIDAKIVDLETGERDLPVGEIGELVLCGPTVMRGYYHHDDETAQALRDGWLHTGDIAHMDADGYFFVVDRKKDMILSNGFNVYPRDVEEVLYSHPAVKEAVVIGAPNDRGDTTVKAYIVRQHNTTPTADELIAFCREHLARYKAPRLIEFREELPKSLIGKPLRRVLVEEEQRKLEARRS